MNENNDANIICFFCHGAKELHLMPGDEKKVREQEDDRPPESEKSVNENN